MPITNGSNRNYTTLHHLFPVPSECRRDFVRENRESVRDKNNPKFPTGKRLTNSHFKGNSKECLYGDSSISSMCLYTGDNTRHPHQDQQVKPQYSETQQQYPQRVKPTTSKQQQNQKSWSTTQQITHKKSSAESMERIPQKSKSSPLQRRQFSNMKVKTNTPKKTSTVAVQTDEIQDEIYLYSALKKCASPAFKAALKAKYQQKDQQATKLGNTAAQTETRENLPEQTQTKSTTKTKQIEANTERHGGGEAGRGNGLQNQFIQSHESESEYPLQLHARNSNARKCHYDPNENLFTARSDVGDHRNVMNLPKEMNKTRCDPKSCGECPNGYHLLNDEERVQIKLKLLEHEALLIRQLNSFPLAIETLRVRQSKTRIEKELSILEQNLRKLSKKKVYAKLNE